MLLQTVRSLQHMTQKIIKDAWSKEALEIYL